MHTSSRDLAPAFRRDGLVSHVLLEPGERVESALTVTWVEVRPGDGQPLHRHEAEQVYVLVGGRGRMRIGEESAVLTAGDMALVPGGELHGIENTGSEVLVYVSAATPAFKVSEVYDTRA
jgi:mannose-6-phosphate isomerase-like protein (cupin superfamily)